MAATICCGQKPMKTAEIIEEIARNNYVAPFPDGFINGETLQHNLYLQLQKTAKTKELVTYTNDQRPIVRIYAIKCLDDRKYKKLFDIAVAHMHDTAKVKVGGHRPMVKYTGDYFVEVQHISEIEREQLDSIILYTDNRFTYLNHLLSEIGTDQKHYERIRHLAGKNEFAVIALARFNRKEDIDLIAAQVLKNSYFTIEAVQVFPAEPFKKTLLTLREQGYNYYGTELAVAAFKDSFSIDYFHQSLLTEENVYQRKQRVKYILEAISEYRSDIFTDLFFELWENEHAINSEIFIYLAIIDREKCIEQSIKSLRNPKELDNSSLVIPAMLDFLRANDSISVKAIIRRNIDSADVHTLKYFVEKAAYFKDTAMINSMFYRLENTTNGHIYVPIVETILLYHDTELNERLIRSIKQNKGIKDWGLDMVESYLERYELKL